jgi:hypothetical protein
MSFPVQSAEAQRDVLKKIRSKKAKQKRTRHAAAVLVDKVVIDDRSVYPNKQHAGAVNKVNLFLGDLVLSLCSMDVVAGALVAKGKWFNQINEFVRGFGSGRGKSGFAVGIASKNEKQNKAGAEQPDVKQCEQRPQSVFDYVILFFEYFPVCVANDMASAFLFWFVLECAGGRQDLAVHIIANVEDQTWLKELSADIKQAGVDALPFLCNYAELQTMYGRATNDADFITDLAKRVEPSLLAKTVVRVDESRMRRCIRNVYRQCLRVKPAYQTKDEYWANRWAFTKSGAHSKAIERAELGGVITPEGRVTRRVFAESMQQSVLARTTPRLLASMAAKLEHGKTRVLYNCDTVSYYNFDYVLRPLEKVWDSSVVMLMPNTGLKADTYKSLADVQGVRLMLDFDDFNSQHALETMVWVFEELREYAGSDVLEWCIAAQRNMAVMSNGEEVRVGGTLFSGHRATTFINTVLNAAYVDYACEGVEFIDRRHAGDDVLLYVRDVQCAEDVLQLMNDAGFRLNSSKQAIGRDCGEFLRTQFTSKWARGYVARAIASLVSGNWLSDHALSEVEYVRTLRDAAMTIALRSGVRKLAGVFRWSVFRRLRSNDERLLLALEEQNSLNGAPTFDGYNRGVEVVMKEARASSMFDARDVKKHATVDYINSHVNTRVLDVLKITCGALVKPMLRSSYAAESVLEWNRAIVVRNLCRCEFVALATAKSYSKNSDPREMWPMSLFPGLPADVVAAAAFAAGREPQDCYVRHPGVLSVCWGMCVTDAAQMQGRVAGSFGVVSGYCVYV